MHYRRLFLLMLCLLSIGGLVATWDYLGLGGHKIFHLELNDDILYASTDDGLYTRCINSPDTVWTHIGMKGESLITSLVINSESIIVSKMKSNSGCFLYRTDNRGLTWYKYEQGMKYEESHRINSLKFYPGVSDTLFAACTPLVVYRRVADEDWETVYGSWDAVGPGIYFLEICPHSPNIMWAGGETAAWRAFLLKSEDYGKNWDYIMIDPNNDNACHAIALHPKNPKILFLGTESKIFKSNDGGLNWDEKLHLTGEDYYDFWGIEVSKNNPDIVYASAFNRRDFQYLKVLVSYDAGDNWSVVKDKYGKYMTRTMFYRFTEGKDELFLGTFGGGVYRFTKEFPEVSVEKKGKHFSAVADAGTHNYPNPFNPKTTIEFSINKEAETTLSVYNIKGQFIKTLHSGIITAGKHSFVWNGRDDSGREVSSGVYLYRLTTGDYEKVEKMLLVK